MNRLIKSVNNNIINIFQKNNPITNIVIKSNVSLNCNNSKYWISVKDRIRMEREERLRREKEYFPTNTSDDLDLIRNVGIIAHIDAGKTTTTERMLYYSGALTAPGEVHDGNTVMDYMDQERERGITIRSAAISFNWRQHQFNIIDTPGHIDFTGEVERALRILDGAVAIFDAVSGVQTQSEMVWYQSNKFEIPRIAFINKMDRSGASLESTLLSIKNRLNIEPLVLQVPLGEGDDFKGIIDVINLLEIHYEDEQGNNVILKPLQKDSKYYDLAMQYRDQLLDTISLYDDTITDMILDGKDLTSEIIEKSIKQILKDNPKDICPILVGSSLKNKGVQLLMDAIIKYLPSPNNENQYITSIKNEHLKRKLDKNEKLTALAYKIINDPEKGALTYVRVYSGSIKQRQVLRNVTHNVSEKGQHLYRVRAKDYVNIKEIGSGDIAAISGLKFSQAGDTLVEDGDMEDFVLEELQMPQPVFMAAINYESLKDKKHLEEVLQTISREDNSFQFKEDEETGQLIGSGLGELHLEVIRDRIEQEFGIKTTLGKMRVTYREGISETSQMAYTFEKMINNRPVYCHLELQIEPIVDIEEDELNEKIYDNNKNYVEFDFERDPEFDIYYREYKRRQQVYERSKSTNSVNQDQNESNQETNLTTAQKSLQGLRFIRNPIKHIEAGKLQDEYGEEVLFHISSMSFELLYALEKTIINGLSKGSLMSYPVIGVRIKVQDGKFSLKRTNEIAINQATSEMIDEMIASANPILLEPTMSVEISTPQHNQKEIMNDAIKIRRGKIMDITEESSKFGQVQSDRVVIKAEIPLVETVGYSSYLRSISSGEAAFLMQFKTFDYVGGQKQAQLLDGDFQF